MSWPMRLLLMEGLLEDDDNDRKRKADDDDDTAQRLLLCAAAIVVCCRDNPFRDHLDAQGRLRRCRKLPRRALVEPHLSLWQRLCSSGHDGALIAVTGHDHAAFSSILVEFAPLFNVHSPWTGRHDGTTHKPIKNRFMGRPRKINATACLGLVLAWYRFRGSEFILQGWFGFAGTPMNAWLRFGRRMLLKALINNNKAKVKMPTPEKIQEYKDVIQRRHPALKHVHCVADGLKLPFQSTWDDEVQGQHFNGWTHGHCITNLFVFAPDGRIVICLINAPGSVHDSTLAEWGGTCNKLETICNETGGICCLDSAFQANEADYLIKSSNDEGNTNNPEECVVNVQATQLRQTAEWGMRAIQSAFPRLTETLKFEECGKERRVYLMLMCLLYNFRVETVGLNQIRNVHVPEWSKDAEYIISNS